MGRIISSIDTSPTNLYTIAMSLAWGPTTRSVLLLLDVNECSICCALSYWQLTVYHDTAWYIGPQSHHLTLLALLPYFLQMHRLLLLTLLQKACVLRLNAHQITAMEWYTTISTPLSPSYGHHSFVSWLWLQLNPQMYSHLANIHPQGSLKTKDQMVEPL